MRTIWQALKRGIGYRLGWVLAGLVLLLLGLDARADPTCPTGETGKWTVTQSEQTMLCSVGEIFTTAAAFQSACLPPHGTVNASNGYLHADGVQQVTYNGTGTTATSRTGMHNPSHGFSSSAASAHAVFACSMPTCDIEPGTIVEIPEPFGADSGQTLCVANCAASVYTGMIVGTDAGNTGTLSWATIQSGAEACTDNVINLINRPRTCHNFDGHEICGYSDEVTQVGDGIIDFPEPDPDQESATSSDVLDDDTDGCTVLPSGGAFCVIGAPGTPDNGTPGIPAEPSATVQGQNGHIGNQTVNYYNSSTVNNSTNHGTGGDPNAPGNCGAPGQPACSTKGSCGGVGQPACVSDIDCGGPGEPLCKVDIDESGSEEIGNDFTQQLQAIEDQAKVDEESARTAGINAATALGQPSDDFNWGAMIPDIPDAACSTISVSFFGQPDKAFPPPILCTFIEDRLKPLLAWFLWFFTVLFMVTRVLTSIAPGR